MTLPTALTPLGVAAAIWGAVDGAPAGGALAAAALAGAYGVWQLRGRQWHDRAAIVPLLVPIGCAVWIVWEHRLPGVGLLGVSCTLIGYHGRHHPLEDER